MSRFETNILYNAHGHRVGYTFGDDKRATVHLNNGRLIAMVLGDLLLDRGGQQIGWFRAGRLYDCEGYVVSTPKVLLDARPQLLRRSSTYNVAVQPSAAQPGAAQPGFSRRWAKINGVDFFRMVMTELRIPLPWKYAAGMA